MMEMAEEEKFTFVEHLDELRSRIIRCVIFIFAFTLLAYPFATHILAAISKPAGKLVFIEPHEAFLANVKISLLGGVFLASPLIAYEVWRFIMSGLTAREKRYIVFFGPLSLLFFIAGCAFGYIVIVPVSMNFFLSFATDFMSPAITVGRYISFISALTLAFGFVFELPLASLFLTKIGLITPSLMTNKRRHAIVIMFVVAAAITPPDVVSQCLMAAPLLILYEIGILFSKMVYRKK